MEDLIDWVKINFTPSRQNGVIDIDKMVDEAQDWMLMNLDFRRYQNEGLYLDVFRKEMYNWFLFYKI